jgi:hypothetical protein
MEALGCPSPAVGLTGDDELLVVLGCASLPCAFVAATVGATG